MSLLGLKSSDSQNHTEHPSQDCLKVFFSLLISLALQGQWAAQFSPNSHYPFISLLFHILLSGAGMLSSSVCKVNEHGSFQESTKAECLSDGAAAELEQFWI